MNVTQLLHELGGIADALNAGDAIHIEPGSVKAARIIAAVQNAEAESEPPEPIKCGLCDATAADVEAAINADWYPECYGDYDEPFEVCPDCQSAKCHIDSGGVMEVNAEYRYLPLDGMIDAVCKELSDIDGDSVYVGMKVWHRPRCQATSKDETEFNIWSSRRNEQYYGKTLIEAAAKFRKAVADGIAITYTDEASMPKGRYIPSDTTMTPPPNDPVPVEHFFKQQSDTEPEITNAADEPF